MVALANRTRAPEEWECSICNDEKEDPVILHTYVTSGDKKTAKKIDHIFHRECIESWLKISTRRECPLCQWKWDDGELKSWVPQENKSQAQGAILPNAWEIEPVSIYYIIGAIVLTILVGVAVVWALMNGIPLVG
jgi:hypothetical protein